MLLKTQSTICICLLSLAFLTGCRKDETHYYPDNDFPGTAIFSNKGNNVFSCFINGVPWRTIDRKIGGFGGSTYEVRITRQNFDSLTDQLSITWLGHYNYDTYGLGSIGLVLSVAKTFSMADFSALQGKRLTIDGVNSYFEAQVDDTNYGDSLRGSGSIYFNTVILNPGVTNGGSQGRISGLLEADFDSVKLTSGRFDHNLDAAQVFFQ